MTSHYTPDRSAPPPAGSPKAFRFPEFTRRRLAGGLTLYAARRPGAALARIALLFPAGGQHDRTVAAGLASFTGALLDEGTRRRSSVEIAGRIERLGGKLSSGADWDSGYLSVELLSSHVADGLALALEIAAEPSFPPEEVERQRRQRLADLLRLRADPGFQAQERLVRTLYGEAHPYGTPLLGTAESLAALDREAVVGFYRRHYVPCGAYAVAAGDLDPDAVAAALEGFLGAVEDRGEAPAPPDLAPPPAAGVTVHVVDRPAAPQTQILLGHPGIPRTHPDFIALSVATTLLGGKFTSRINLNLRERHGYTYGASCQLGSRLGPAPLSVSAAVGNAVAGAAVREVLGELARIRDEPVGEAELDETRDYLIGVFPYTLQTISGLAGRLETLAVYGLPDDYYAGYAERLRAIGPERIAEVARRHLHPDRLAVVAVGPAAELGPQLEGLGEIVTGGEAVEVGQGVPSPAAAGDEYA